MALVPLSARGIGFASGLPEPRARVRIASTGIGFASGRATITPSATGQLAAFGFGASLGGIARISVVTQPPPRVVTPLPDVNVVGYDTLLLDRTTWDLVVDAYGNIAAAQAPYGIEQDVASAIRLFLGELWYDTTKGIPYFERVLGHAPPLPVLKSMIERAALSVPRVAAARVFVTDIQGRVLTGQVQVTTTAGQQFVITETFLGNSP